MSLFWRVLILDPAHIFFPFHLPAQMQEEKCDGEQKSIKWKLDSHCFQQDVGFLCPGVDIIS